MSNDDNFTIPSRKRKLDAVTRFTSDDASETPDSAPPTINPWALQSYIDGEGDVIKTLSARYPQMPVMSLIHLRDEKGSAPRGVASISTQDGAANVIIEVDASSKAVQFTFGLSSMLALRFQPGVLNDRVRALWIETMQREMGEPAFLWNQARWEHDYILSASTKTFTTCFAFSPHHVEAAARFTRDVSNKLIEWLSKYWGIS